MKNETKDNKSLLSQNLLIVKQIIIFCTLHKFYNLISYKERKESTNLQFPNSTMVIHTSRNTTKQGRSRSRSRSGNTDGDDEACYIRKSAIGATTEAAAVALARIPTTTTTTTTSHHSHKHKTHPTSSMNSKKIKTSTISQSSPTSSTSSGKANRVQFDSIIIHPIPLRNQYTAREKLLTWYNGEEFMEMKTSALKLARQLDQQQQHGDNSTSTHSTAATESIWSWSSLSSLSAFNEQRQEGHGSKGESEPDDPRGLERILRKNIKNHSGRRRALNDELAFINKNRGSSHINADDLALLFRSYTALSATEAVTMARTDEATARQIYSTDTNFMKYFFSMFGPNVMLLSKSSPSKHQSNTKKIILKNEKQHHQQKQQRQHSQSHVTAERLRQSQSSTTLMKKQQFRDSISNRLVAARSIR
jgi:hypothetical protein